MRIYNSLTRRKEEFVPLKKNKVGIYVCGPTVYDEPHIGHARSAYIFDVVRRYLSRKYEVTFVRNVTDVDDKIIDRARQVTKSQGHQITSLMETTRKVSKKYLDAYHEDMDLLGIGKPDREPLATEYIPKMVKFIALLIEKGRAYESAGDVYFDIRQANGYGKLSNQDLDKMEAGARISSGEEKKKDPLDFALWKKAKEGEPSWNSPWGSGRPGWHIECSAMSSDILGDEFDIHGGGIDLIFPHHENEIAQSEGAGKTFARCWMHNGLLTINGEKMAKSLGNYISIKDFVAKYKDADLLKIFFLSTLYSHPIDYNEKKIEEARVALRTFREFLFYLIDRDKKLKLIHPDFGVEAQITNTETFRKKVEDCKAEFIQAMDNDFNMPEARAALFKLRDYAWSHTHPLRCKIEDLEYAKDIIIELGQVLGLFASNDYQIGIDPGLKLYIEEKVLERNEARRMKNFKKSDSIREDLFLKNIILEDTKDGTVWRRKL